MNSAALAAFMELFKIGDTKRAQKEYDRRQAAQEAKTERLMAARESIAERKAQETRDWMEQRNNDRLQLEHDWRLKDKADEEQRKSEDTIKNASALKALAHSNVPFWEQNPEHIAMMVKLAGGDPDKAEKLFERAKAGATIPEVAADIAKAKASSAASTLAETIDTAKLPTAARDAVSASNLANATAMGGGVTPAAAVGNPNLIVMKDDGSRDVLSNPWFKTEKQRDSEAAMKMVGSMGNSSDPIHTLANAAGFGQKTVTGTDANGRPVTLLAKQWGPEAGHPANQEPDIRPSVWGGTFDANQGSISNIPAPIVQGPPAPSVVPRGYEQYREALNSRLPGTTQQEELPVMPQSDYIREALARRRQEPKQTVLYMPE
jgi:hypothetical protein